MEYKIVEKIEAKGMTVAEFIEKMGWKQRSSLYNMMSGNPTMQQLEKIASVLECKVSDLLSEGFAESSCKEKEDVIVCPKCGAKLELKVKEE